MTAPIFTKNIKFESEFVQTIFNDVSGALMSINGRLNGFFPTAVGGDVGTPGISSTSVGVGTFARAITVNLLPPTTADDLRFGISNPQLTSYAVANGVLLKTDHGIALNPVLVSVTVIETTTLTSPDPLTIYVTYDDSSAAPTFSVKRQSAIDANPQTIAKLAYYDPTSQTWQPSQQVAMAGLVEAVTSTIGKFGGFTVAAAGTQTLQINPGTIVGSYGRIISNTIRLMATQPLAAAGKFRKDLLVVNDPFSETASPTFTVLKGDTEGAGITITSPTPRPTSPTQVPLAEILMSDTEISALADARPIQAWQTDAMMQALPMAFAQMKVVCVQPGIIMTDTTQSVNETWSVSIFRALTPTGGVGAGKLAFGVVGLMQSRSFAGPAGPGAFTPDQTTQFPPSPYISSSTFKVISHQGGGSIDVTANPLYAIKFDFLGGVFATNGITTQFAFEPIEVQYQQVATVFAIDDDGTVHLPALDLFYAHIAAANPAAHTATNIVYNNSIVRAPGTTTPTLSTQVALEKTITALNAIAPGGVAKPDVFTMVSDRSVILTVANPQADIMGLGGEVMATGAFTVSQAGVSLGFFRTAGAALAATSAKVHFCTLPSDFSTFPGSDLFSVTIGLAAATGVSGTLRGSTLLGLASPVVFPPSTVIYMWLELTGGTATTALVSVRCRLYGSFT